MKGHKTAMKGKKNESRLQQFLTLIEDNYVPHREATDISRQCLFYENQAVIHVILISRPDASFGTGIPVASF